MSTKIGSQDFFGDHVFQSMAVLYYATRSTMIHFFFLFFYCDRDLIRGLLSSRLHQNRGIEKQGSSYSDFIFHGMATICLWPCLASFFTKNIVHVNPNLSFVQVVIVVADVTKDDPFPLQESKVITFASKSHKMIIRSVLPIVSTTFIND